MEVKRIWEMAPAHLAVAAQRCRRNMQAQSLQSGLEVGKIKGHYVETYGCVTCFAVGCFATADDLSRARRQRASHEAQPPVDRHSIMHAAELPCRHSVNHEPLLRRPAGPMNCPTFSWQSQAL